MAESVAGHEKSDSDGIETPKQSLINRRTAILIIHGVGQQEKYQTVSDFAAGLKTAIERLTQSKVLAERVPIALSNGVESVLRLSPDPSKVPNEKGTASIDIVEYYYQPFLQRQVTVSDVVDWLVTTSARIRDLYKEHQELGARYINADTTGTGQLSPNYMLYRIAYVIPLLAFLAKLLKSCDGIPYARAATKTAVNFLFASIGQALDPLIIDFAGDVTAYTAIDSREKLSSVRETILSNSVTLLRDLWKRSHGYDQIIVAGHSLGSAVAYDTLSRLSAQIASDASKAIQNGDLRRIVGLVTFGSPLDKIALYFWPYHPRDKGSKNEVINAWKQSRLEIQRGMLQQFHGMRGLSRRLPGYAALVRQPTTRPFHHVIWINYFHPSDIIAGNLDAFTGVSNVRTYAKAGEAHYDAADQKFPGAHSFYWYDPLMHGSIVNTFLTNDITPCFWNEDKLTKVLEKIETEGLAPAPTTFWVKLNRCLGM